MATVTSCGVIVLNTRRELFVCHATGTARWDLPKGIGDAGESALETAVRETWEETALWLDPSTLLDLGVFAYLPGKRLHLFAVRVEPDAFDISACGCHSTFPHHATGRPTPEVDGYAWKPIAQLANWCGKNLSKVLGTLDWERLGQLPVVPKLHVRGHVRARAGPSHTE